MNEAMEKPWLWRSKAIGTASSCGTRPLQCSRLLGCIGSSSRRASSTNKTMLLTACSSRSQAIMTPPRPFQVGFSCPYPNAATGSSTSRRKLVRLYCSRSSKCFTFLCIASIVSALARLLELLVVLLQRIRASAFHSAEIQTAFDGKQRLLCHGGGLGMALLSTSAIAKAHLSPVLVTLKANPTFMSGLMSWMVAQASKVVTTYIVYRRLDLSMLVGSGGMPSSHSALCVGLTTSVALSHGVADALFPVCLGFSLIVMYDATGVRRHAGMQAQVLNLIIKDLFQGHPVSERKLKELLGHTPLQVLAGAVVGMVVGWWCSSQPSSVSL